jgi:hypothetical protein
MKQIYVLDENVLIQSFTCKDNDSVDDFDSGELVAAILRKCHKIGLSCELRKRYFDKMKSLETVGKTTTAARIWTHLLYRKDKFTFCESNLKNLPASIEHDHHVIEPALFLSGILVTTDNKLREKLTQWCEKQGYQIEIKSPRNAIEYLDSLK